jgi:hypothetical protein
MGGMLCKKTFEGLNAENECEIRPEAISTAKSIKW